jgi:hypothetical protein
VGQSPTLPKVLFYNIIFEVLGCYFQKLLT